MKKIISIIGARPQFIKHAPMQIQLSKYFNAITIHTGQHYDDDMSRVFFEELNITRPEYIFDLGDVKLQGEQTATMMIKIEQVLMNEKPQAILIYGDTNSTLAACLIASKMHIPIIHVEAGLRSYNRSMPEEINRIVADTFSEILFCPTHTAVKNLKKEGIEHSNIYLSGDVMADMVLFFENKLQAPNRNPYYFATIHRPYNTDDKQRLIRILDAFQKLDKKVIFSIHPRTLFKIREWGLDITGMQNIEFLGPVSYLDSLAYQKFADCIITDSGGMQKEAYILRKKCITLRKETEWLETLEGGWNTLVFDDLNQIQEAIKVAPGNYKENMYGTGHAAEEIVELIVNLI